jgi:hypothetical protein
MSRYRHGVTHWEACRHVQDQPTMRPQTMHNSDKARDIPGHCLEQVPAGREATPRAAAVNERGARTPADSFQDRPRSGPSAGPPIPLGPVGAPRRITRPNQAPRKTERAGPARLVRAHVGEPCEVVMQFRLSPSSWWDYAKRECAARAGGSRTAIFGTEPRCHRRPWHDLAGRVAARRAGFGVLEERAPPLQAQVSEI